MMVVVVVGYVSNYADHVTLINNNVHDAHDEMMLM